MRPPSFYLLVFMAAILGSPGFGATLALTHGRDNWPLTAHFEAIADDTAQLSADEALGRFAAGAKRLALEPETERLNFVRGAVWLIVKVNNHDHPQGQWLLQLADSIAPNIDVFVFNGDHLESAQVIGSRVAKSSQIFQERQPLAAISVPLGATRTVLIRMMHDSLNLKATLATAEAFHRDVALVTSYYGAYFAAVSALLVYNTFLYFALGHVVYLYFVLYLASTLVAVLIQSGYGSLAADWLVIAGDHVHIYQSLALLGCLMFSRSFLKLETIAPRLDRCCLVGGVFCAALIGALHTSLAPVATVAAHALILVTMVLSLGIGVVARRRGLREARFFIVAWPGFCFATVLGIMVQYGLASDLGMWSELAPLVGQGFAVICLALGLADNINTLTAEKRAAEVKAQEGERNRLLLRVISHDLVNPLSIIQNFATMNMKSDEAAANSGRAWERVLVAATHQKAIIDHVATMTDFISGNRNIELMPVDITELVKELKPLFEKAIADKKIDVILSVPDRPLYALAEASSLQNNVFCNVLSNAIKFSPTGSKLTITVLDLGAEVRVVIADQGIGMDQKLVARLFDVSAVTSRLGTVGEKGTGFGMPIVKSYMDQFGGTITVESRPEDADPINHGTTFTLTLKAAHAKVTAAA